MKKLLTLVLALVMMMSIASFAMAEEEVITATAIVFTSPGYTPVKDSYGVNYIKDRWGLYLDILPVDSGTNESWNTFWAGGGYADVIIPYGRNQITPLLDEEICRPFPAEWIAEYAPRLMTLGVMMFGSEEQFIKSSSEPDGQLYCIPYFGGTSGISWVAMIRKDWMEAVGITKIPETIDELTALFDAFVNGDPDGNGEADTYAIPGEQYGAYNIAAAFGTTAWRGYFQNEDGSYWTNIVTDEWRAYLSQMNAWFDAGYIDPEFVTDDRAAVRAKLANGKYGMYCDNPWWFEEGRGEVGPINMLIANNPEFDWSMVVPFANVKDANGEIKVIRDVIDPRGQAAVHFGYDCPDEVIIKMLEITNARVRLNDGTPEDFDVMITRAEMDTGIEGEQWTYEEGNTQVTTIGNASTGGWTGADSSAMGLYLIPTAASTDLKFFEGKVDEFVIEMYNMSTSANYQWYNRDAVLPVLEGEYADIASMVADTYATWKTAFILGEKDIDDDAVWAEWLAEIEAAGLSKVLDKYAELSAAA